MKVWWGAVRSGFKAGLKQYRKRRTELKKAPAPIVPALPLFPNHEGEK